MTSKKASTYELYWFDYQKWYPYILKQEEEPLNVSSLVDAKRAEDEKYELIGAQLRNLEERKRPIIEALKQYQAVLVTAEANASTHTEKVQTFQVRYIYIHA
jgi:hypothetical protein